MGYITKYGSFWGQIPQTNGQVFWVAPAASYTVEGRTYSASDGNDGLSPERAFLTLAQAITKATASVNDVIVLLPGAHSWATQPVISKAGLTVMGLPGGKGNPERQRTSITLSAADEVLGVTAARVEIAFLHIICVTAQTGIEFSGDNLFVHNCSFDMATAAASTSTIGIAATAAVNNLRVEDCYFQSSDAQGPYIALGNITNAWVERVQARHTGTTALADGFKTAGTSVNAVFKDVTIVSPAAALITDSFDWTSETTDASLMLINVAIPTGSGVNAAADGDVVVNGLTQILQVADGASTLDNAINAS